MRPGRFMRPILLAIVLLLSVVACGNENDDRGVDSSTTTTTTQTEAPSTTQQGATSPTTTAPPAPSTTVPCPPVPANPDPAQLKAEQCGLKLQMTGTGSCPSAGSIRLEASGFTEGRQYRTSVWDAQGKPYYLTNGSTGSVTAGGKVANWVWVCEVEENYGNYVAILEELGTGRWAGFILPVLAAP